MPAYTSKQVALIAKVSLRQLQWWDERHLVVVRKNGHRREYTHWNLREVCVIGELRRKGVTIQKIRKLAGAISSIVYESDQHYIATDGRVVQSGQAEEIIAWSAKAKRPVVVVSLADWIQRIETLGKRRAA